MTKIRQLSDSCLRSPHLASTAFDALSNDWRRPAPGHSCLAFRIRTQGQTDPLPKVESW
jgi:hypothetical protein